MTVFSLLDLSWRLGVFSTVSRTAVVPCLSFLRNSRLKIINPFWHCMFQSGAERKAYPHSSSSLTDCTWVHVHCTGHVVVLVFLCIFGLTGYFFFVIPLILFLVAGVLLWTTCLVMTSRQGGTCSVSHMFSLWCCVLSHSFTHWFSCSLLCYVSDNRSPLICHCEPFVLCMFASTWTYFGGRGFQATRSNNVLISQLYHGSRARKCQYSSC